MQREELVEPPLSLLRMFLVAFTHRLSCFKVFKCHFVEHKEATSRSIESRNANNRNTIMLVLGLHYVSCLVIVC